MHRRFTTVVGSPRQTLRGEDMITYIGVGFVLFGMFLFLVSASNPSGLGISLALGVVVFGMGMVLAYVGSKMGSAPDLEEPDLVEARNAQPLSYFFGEDAQAQGLEAKAGGERALGFVLLSLGLFVLTVAGVFGLFLGSWPLTLLGVGLVLPGVILRRR